MAFSYQLPISKTAENPEGIEHRATEQNSLIIIGANGSGKSRLGAWMEDKDLKNVHRVSGQRALNFAKHIPVKSEQTASNKLLYGVEDKQPGSKLSRWGFSHDLKRPEYTTHELNDCDDVLALLFARHVSKSTEFMDKARQAQIEHKEMPRVEDSELDVLINTWNKIMSHRQIVLKDYQVVIKFGVDTEYAGTEMSDGEKAILYLMAQCLCVPSGHTIIIDEPEIHMHHSIMNKLWTEMEKVRPDCLFIYITHDTTFAANHKASDKIWVKSFDGDAWEYEYVPKESALSQQLMMDILGARRKVLFVEGTDSSWDVAVYSEFFSKYYVVPCGSCSNVVQNVRAMRSEPQLHHLDCFGLIDRDYRTDDEIRALEQDKVFVIGVAEVENLFCTDGILRIINQQLCKPDESAVASSCDYIRNEFERDKGIQIQQAVLAELKHRIKHAISKDEIDGVIGQYAEIERVISKKYNCDVNNNDNILRLFNRKGLASSIGKNFGLAKGDEYINLVINLFRGDKHNDIREALRPYMPTSDKIPN